MSHDYWQWVAIAVALLALIALWREQGDMRRKVRCLESATEYQEKLYRELQTERWELARQVDRLENGITKMAAAMDLDRETNLKHRGHVSTVVGRLNALGHHLNVVWVEDKNVPGHWEFKQP